MNDSQVNKLRDLKNRERGSGQQYLQKKNKRPTLFSVTSGKGGVGKSNFALNTAIVLSEMKQNVLLIDADTNLANLDILLGINPRYNLSDLITGDKFLNDIILRGPGGIDILPGSSGVIELIDIENEVKNKLIDCFRSIEEKYDLIIIDTGAGLTPAIVSYVINSDEVIVVTNPEPTSITDAYAMIKIISSKNPSIHINILVNLVDSTKEGDDVFDKLNLVAHNFLQFPLDHLGNLPRDSNVSRAVSVQIPFIIKYPRSAVSNALRLSARKLLRGRIASDSTRQNLFSRIFEKRESL